MLANEDEDIVTQGCRILAKLLVAHGSGYTTKFAVKSGGFIIMADRLKRFWDRSGLWPICFSILFGFDPANLSVDQGVELSSLLPIFSKRKVLYPEFLIVIISMLQQGLADISKCEDDGGNADTTNGSSNSQGSLSKTDSLIANGCE